MVHAAAVYDKRFSSFRPMPGHCRGLESLIAGCNVFPKSAEDPDARVFSLTHGF